MPYMPYFGVLSQTTTPTGTVHLQEMPWKLNDINVLYEDTHFGGPDGYWDMGSIWASGSDVLYTDLSNFTVNNMVVDYANKTITGNFYFFAIHTPDFDWSELFTGGIFWLTTDYSDYIEIYMSSIDSTSSEGTQYGSLTFSQTDWDLFVY